MSSSAFGFDLNAIIESLGDHSIFSPSGSAMWTVCAGSLIPNILAGDTSSPEAAEGTVAHSVAEQWLTSGVKPRHLVGTVVDVAERDGKTYHIDVTHSMLDFVESYVTWCWQQDGDHFVETRVDFSDLTPIPKQTGTADHCACLPGLLVITDLKFGKGLQVFAKNNPQLLIYAYGFFRQYDWFYDFQRIVIRIAQPRLGHWDTFEVSREELLAFAEWVKARALAAWQPDAPRTPGAKQCQWCKVKKDCLPLTMFICEIDRFGLQGEHTFSEDELDHFLAEITDELGGGIQMSLPDRSKLTFEQKCELLRYKRMAEKFWKDLEADIEAELFNGGTSEQWKLVEGKSSRIITDPELAAEELEFMGLDHDEIFKQDIRSFGDLEEALKAKGFRNKDLPNLFKSFVRKPPGRPTLVPIDDTRAPLDTGIDDVFD